MNKQAITEDLIPQPVLLEVAGVSNVTFNSWRKRNGLFPRTTGDRKWNKYSPAEVVTAAVVVDLTGAGVAAQQAVDMAMKSMPAVERILRGELEANLLIYRRNGPREFEVLAGRYDAQMVGLHGNDLGSVAVVVDLGSLLIGVLERFTAKTRLQLRAKIGAGLAS